MGSRCLMPAAEVRASAAGMRAGSVWRLRANMRRNAMSTASQELARWVTQLRYEDLPAEVVQSSRYRVLDVIGLALAGVNTIFGQSVRHAAARMGAGPAHVVGTGEALAASAAAFANGALSQALEYDDTHNESVVHMSSGSVGAALALAEAHGLNGRDVILGVAIGNEVACRVGSVATGKFHKLGFHPTGLFSPFGVAYGASRLLGNDATQMANAAGIVGSFAAGLLECWVDGTASKFLHPGWAAHGGIVAAELAQGGCTGPATVFEGRFGMIATHLQDASAPRDFGRITRGLGSLWESQRASFKPFPAAHVIHPYLDAVLRLKREHGFEPSQVVRIDCPVAAWFMPVVCDPREEKLAPRSDSHGRVSLYFSLAEALMRGRLGRDAYAPESLVDPEILRLAACVHCQADPSWPGPERFKGAVRITLADGRVLKTVEEYNRGSPENPMTEAEILAKFEDNATAVLPATRARELAAAVLRLDEIEDVAALVRRSIAA
jgi:2-methylcitrate dehydratase PrpD